MGFCGYLMFFSHLRGTQKDRTRIGCPRISLDLGEFSVFARADHLANVVRPGIWTVAGVATGSAPNRSMEPTIRPGGSFSLLCPKMCRLRRSTCSRRY